jgi:hypothetical protein
MDQPDLVWRLAALANRGNIVHPAAYPNAILKRSQKPIFKLVSWMTNSDTTPLTL